MDKIRKLEIRKIGHSEDLKNGKFEKYKIREMKNSKIEQKGKTDL